MKSRLTSAPQLPTRKESPMKSLLASRPVLWFLFLFNAAVAIAVAAGGHHLHIHGQTLHGTQQIVTCAGMGVVALGAFAGLLRRRPQPA
jgi:MYXO-CTERM domain-containing protein